MKNENEAFVKIETDIDPFKDGVKGKYSRSLSCIKITANNPDAHFIQFCTRQRPNLFEYRDTNGKTIAWDEIRPYYMKDSLNPKWKLDIVYGCDLYLMSLKEFESSKKEGYSYIIDNSNLYFCENKIEISQIVNLKNLIVERSKEDTKKPPCVRIVVASE